MQLTSLCAFPLGEVFHHRFFITSLQWGAKGSLGFGIRASTSDHNSTVRPLTFFQIDSVSGMVFSQTLSLHSEHLEHLELFYDETTTSWIMSLSGRDREVELLRFPASQKEPHRLPELLAFTRIEEAQARSDQVGFMAFVRHAQTYSWSFEVGDSAERGDGEVYWFHLKLGAVPPERRLQWIGIGARVAHYATERASLFFLLQRSSLHGRPRIAEENEPGEWQFLLAAYEPDGMLRHQTVLPGVTIPVQHNMFPLDDFDQGWLKPGMRIVPGPASGPGNEPTCIAALTLLAGTPPEERFKGGLYLLNMWGDVLQYDPGPFGESPRLWSYGEGVVGIDVVAGEKRLWQWLPFSNKPLEVLALFPDDVRRVTIVPPTSERGNHHPLFWCLEEYARGVRISRWEGNPITEQETVWWKRGQLLARFDGQVHGVVASSESLYFLAFDEQQKLTLFHVR